MVRMKETLWAYSFIRCFNVSGDEILQINGVHIKDNKTHGEVIELFIKSPDPCVVRVRRSKQVPEQTGNDQEAPPSYEECQNLSQTVTKPKII